MWLQNEQVFYLLVLSHLIFYRHVQLMRRILYIIPGLEETTRRRPYQVFRKIAQEKGYEVVFRNID